MPLIIIDKERFAERESTKIDIIKKLINGESVEDLGREKGNLDKYGNFDKDEYANLVEQYGKLTKAELIQEVITKFENNRTGLMFNKKLNSRFFTQLQLKGLMSTINNAIDNMQPQERKVCTEALINASSKELEKLSNSGQWKNVIRKMFWTKVLKENSKLRENMPEYDVKDAYNNTENNDHKPKPELTQNEKENVANMIKKISSTDFYDKCTVHSIEHIQKVMVFADILAKGEGLSNDDRKLLLIAAAFHDSARKGRDGDTPHSIESAINAGEVLKENNSYGISNPQDIMIIQTAIAYHEFPDPVQGQMDIKKIKKIAKEYASANDIKKEEIDLERIAKICELLKDADALDRYRFASRGKLEPSMLRCETSKNPEVMQYAKNMNEMFARKVLMNIYGYKEEQINDGEALMILSEERRMKQYENNEYIEPHLEMDELLEIYDLQPEIKKEKNQLKHSKKEFIIQAYEDTEINIEDVNESVIKAKENYQQLKYQENDQDKENGLKRDGPDLDD